MSRYEPLSRHLSQREDNRWTASFDQIENILGAPLPGSAFKYPAWWANQNGSGHIQSAAWQRAGWRTAKLDLERRRVDFERIRDESSARSDSPLRDQIENRIARARELTGMMDRDEIIAAALQLFIERQAAKALMALGGTMPDFELPPRRRIF